MPFDSRDQQKWYYATGQTYLDDEPHSARQVETSPFDFPPKSAQKISLDSNYEDMIRRLQPDKKGVIHGRKQMPIGRFGKQDESGTSDGAKKGWDTRGRGTNEDDKPKLTSQSLGSAGYAEYGNAQDTIEELLEQYEDDPSKDRNFIIQELVGMGFDKEIADLAYDDLETKEPEPTVNPNDVTEGDYVDFGPYGKLYVVDKDYLMSGGKTWWVTDDPEELGKDRPSGWSISPHQAVKILKLQNDDEIDEGGPGSGPQSSGRWDDDIGAGASRREREQKQGARTQLDAQRHVRDIAKFLGDEEPEFDYQRGGETDDYYEDYLLPLLDEQGGDDESKYFDMIDYTGDDYIPHEEGGPGSGPRPTGKSDPELLGPARGGFIKTSHKPTGDVTSWEPHSGSRQGDNFVYSDGSSMPMQQIEYWASKGYVPDPQMSIALDKWKAEQNKNSQTNWDKTYGVGKHYIPPEKNPRKFI